MSRRRYISTAISHDKEVNKLACKSDFAALLYTWLIPHAEDTAYLPSSDPEELLYRVLPGRRDKTAEDVKEAINLIVFHKLLISENGDLRFPPDNFFKYQSYISDSRKSDSAKQRKTAQNASSFKLKSKLKSKLKKEYTLEVDEAFKKFNSSVQAVQNFIAVSASQNKTGLITEPRKLSLLCQLADVLTETAEEDIFKSALQEMTGKGIANVNYLKKIIKSRKERNAESRGINQAPVIGSKYAGVAETTGE